MQTGFGAEPWVGPVPVRGKSPTRRKPNELFPVYDRGVQVQDLKQINPMRQVIDLPRT